ncbi:5-formyltetrahydrofolate cyclo-ligase [Alteromonas gracilis]|uniref:5-formyltetrahydrofolate cyclo-ligase n=1 Tax=Alteromonas gracilis TaxID=1479524 RepID=UPI00373612E0
MPTFSKKGTTSKQTTQGQINLIAPSSKHAGLKTTAAAQAGLEGLMQSRAQLRKTLREARRNLSAQQHEAAALGVAKQLATLSLLNDARVVAGYLVNDGEVNLKHYINTVWQAPHASQFALPVLHPICKGHLLFLSYAPDTKLVKNKYSIEEPELSCANVVPVSQCNVILMPLVGFDLAGNRLGMGGGYYDRTLSFTQHHSNTNSPICPRKPKLVGIAHDIQQVDTLPIASWDVPLDAIVTPTRTLQFTK